MRTNDVKRKVAGGGVSIGTFVFEFNSTGIGRLAASWHVVDHVPDELRGPERVAPWDT